MLTYIGVVVLCIVVFFGFCSIKYNNPYKLIMIFGRKGCGKTTYLAKTAMRYIRAGWTVYSTEPIPGTLRITADMIGQIRFCENSVLLIDEAGITYDNRKYKSFADDKRDFYKYQRHYKVRVYLFSQTFDIDVKLRTLTDEMYMLRNFCNVLTICRKLKLKQSIIKATGMSEACIKDDIVRVPLIFGGVSFVWLPKFWKYFDSFNQPLQLRDINLRQTPYPDGVKQVTPRRRSAGHRRGPGMIKSMVKRIRSRNRNHQT